MSDHVTPYPRTFIESFYKYTIPYEGPRSILRLRARQKNPACQFTTTGEGTVEGRPAVGLRMKLEGGPEATWYFDKESGLLLKTEQRTKRFEGEDSVVETLYGDYQTLGGFPMARKVTSLRDGQAGVHDRADRLPRGVAQRGRVRQAVSRSPARPAAFAVGISSPKPEDRSPGGRIGVNLLFPRIGRGRGRLLAPAFHVSRTASQDSGRARSIGRHADTGLGRPLVGAGDFGTTGPRPGIRTASHRISGHPTRGGGIHGQPPQTWSAVRIRLRPSSPSPPRSFGSSRAASCRPLSVNSSRDPRNCSNDSGDLRYCIN